MIDLTIYDKEYQLKEAHGRYYLFYEGSQIAELINGKEGLEKQYKGSFEKWVDKIKKRDLQRIENIDYQVGKLEEERGRLSDRWL